MPDPLKLAAIVGRITIWHAAIPAPTPKCFDCQTLTRELGLPMNRLHMPLTLLGWHRAEVWHRTQGKRFRRVYYAPPGHRVPRPARGRPRFRLEDHYDAINYL